jgi:hypothetical protein
MSGVARLAPYHQLRPAGPATHVARDIHYLAAQRFDAFSVTVEPDLLEL